MRPDVSTTREIIARTASIWSRISMTTESYSSISVRP
jgi:hypothetical protein